MVCAAVDRVVHGLCSREYFLMYSKTLTGFQVVVWYFPIIFVFFWFWSNRRRRSTCSTPDHCGTSSCTSVCASAPPPLYPVHTSSPGDASTCKLSCTSLQKTVVYRLVLHPAHAALSHWVLCLVMEMGFGVLEAISLLITSYLVKHCHTKLPNCRESTELSNLELSLNSL